MNRLTDINMIRIILFLVFIGLHQFSYGQKKIEQFVLVLDAGHGGRDPGAIGVVKNEKVINLEVTQRLGKLIEDYYKDDVKVIYTRRNDTFIPLHERANIANRNDADFFISIHCNSARPTAHGTETFVLGTEDHRSSSNFNIVKKENSVILLEEDYEERYQNFDPTSPESVIGLTLMQNIHLENSLRFAERVERNFVQKDKRVSRGVKQAGFLVLWHTATPSILIELGFISNPEEGKYLASAEGQRKTAESIFNAFKDYKREWDIRKGHPVKAEPSEQLVKIEDEKQPKVEAEKPVEGKFFKIQYLTSTRKYRATAPQLKGIIPSEIMRDGKLYKYFYGRTNLKSVRDENLAKVKRAGFPDAFVVEVSTKQNTSTAQAPEIKPEPKAQEPSDGYRIQILTSQRNYDANAPQMKGIRPIDKYLEDGLYRYFYGWFESDTDARKELNTIKTRGFPDAFIVKFKGGKKE